jgi:inosose dehydratase
MPSTESGAGKRQARIRMDRRQLLTGAAGLAGAIAADGTWAQPRGLDPANPDIKFGAAGYIWGTDLSGAVADTRRLGLQGLEPYRQHIPQYATNPAPLKAMFDAAGIALPTCSNGGAGQSTNFIDPAATPQTIADHVKFAREFLVPFGATVFKINVGARPAGGPNDEQLKTMAAALNEIGRQTAAMGIRLAPHPHIWGPLERGEEVRRIMELTDPRYVWLTTDTAHLTLGGMDAVRIIDEFFPRVAHVHLKDCEARYRGNAQTPTRAQHDQASVYKNLGVGGGVDFPAVFKVLRDRRYKGWVVLDLDPPRAGDGTGDIHDNLATNVNYLRNVLGVRLPEPRRA